LIGSTALPCAGAPPPGTCRFQCKYPNCLKMYSSTDAVRKHCRKRHLEWLRKLDQVKGPSATPAKTHFGESRFLRPAWVSGCERGAPRCARAHAHTPTLRPPPCRVGRRSRPPAPRAPVCSAQLAAHDRYLPKPALYCRWGSDTELP